MEQHPIPQNISSYEFRLVGDMTLKQFLQLAAGIVSGIIIYRLPLPALVRYPLVFAAVVLGITLAFVPINGRPFARYIWVFLTAIYSPAEFIWRHLDKVTPTATAPTLPLPNPSSPPAVAVEQTTSDLTSSPSSTIEPTLSPSSLVTPTSQTPPSPPENAQPDTPLPSSPPETLSSSTAPDSLSASPGRPIFSSTSPDPITSPQPIVSSPLPDVSKSVDFTNLIIRPDQPNLLTGLVTTPDGKSIENAIVELTDTANGMPVRALRTNRLGQFQIATPLSKGAYILQVEKPGLEFEPVRLTAAGTIIDPVIIHPLA